MDGMLWRRGAERLDVGGLEQLGEDVSIGGGCSLSD